MTTQAMYDNGLRCKGKGFNCSGCKNKDDCVEYINTNVKVKPPLGIAPKYVWEVERMNDLKSAIDKYIQAGLEVSIEWTEEYNDLIKKYKS